LPWRAHPGPTFGNSPAKVGIDLVPLNLPITVNTVDPVGPAAAAGISPGDHVVTIDGQSLQGMLPDGANTLLLHRHRLRSDPARANQPHDSPVSRPAREMDGGIVWSRGYQRTSLMPAYRDNRTGALALPEVDQAAERHA
jgi:hypothetical protein